MPDFDWKRRACFSPLTLLADACSIVSRHQSFRHSHQDLSLMIVLHINMNYVWMHWEALSSSCWFDGVASQLVLLWDVDDLAFCKSLHISQSELLWDSQTSDISTGWDSSDEPSLSQALCCPSSKEFVDDSTLPISLLPCLANRCCEISRESLVLGKTPNNCEDAVDRSEIKLLSPLPCLFGFVSGTSSPNVNSSPTTSDLSAWLASSWIGWLSNLLPKLSLLGRESDAGSVFSASDLDEARFGVSDLSFPLLTGSSLMDTVLVSFSLSSAPLLESELWDELLSFLLSFPLLRFWDWPDADNRRLMSNRFCCRPSICSTDWLYLDCDNSIAVIHNIPKSIMQDYLVLLGMRFKIGTPDLTLHQQASQHTALIYLARGPALNWPLSLRYCLSFRPKQPGMQESSYSSLQFLPRLARQTVRDLQSQSFLLLVVRVAMQIYSNQIALWYIDILTVSLLELQLRSDCQREILPLSWSLGNASGQHCHSHVGLGILHRELPGIEHLLNLSSLSPGLHDEFGNPPLRR